MPLCRLNQQRVKDKFPIPLIEDVMDELGGSSIYSKLDLCSGYHQVRIEEGEERSKKQHSKHMHGILSIW